MVVAKVSPKVLPVLRKRKLNGHLVLSTSHVFPCISADGRYHSAQVKLEPGNGARLAMFSARFNARNKEAWIAATALIEAVIFFEPLARESSDILQ